MAKIMTNKRMRAKGLIAAGVVGALCWWPVSVFADTSTSGSSSDPASSSSAATGSTATSTSQTTGQADQTTATTGGSTTNTASDPTATSAPAPAGSTTQPSTSGTQATAPTSTNSTTSPTSSASSGSTQNPAAPQSDPQGSVTNNIDSSAKSGDASVTYNKNGGDATSGSASATATLVNAIDTSLGVPLQQFTYDINGNQSGDIMLDPSNYLNQLDAAGATLPATIQTVSSLENYLTLLAASGDATVANNRRAGNATTGDATTEANLINLINSSINSNQLFLGFINIYGTLDGNILIPQSLIDALLGSPSSGGNPSTGSLASAYTVNNQVSLLAQSGNADVTGNLYGGSATTGSAATSLDSYNLINSQIVGGNLLLVFVNVFGTWTGMLFNAPAGTDVAALGGDIQQYVSALTAPTAANGTTLVNNVFNLSSISGDASVMNNRYGGNATSGNAMAAADIVNLLGDRISLSGWLGILFINVFGTWHGSLLSAQPVVVYPLSTGGSNTGMESLSGNTSQDGSVKLAVFVRRPHANINGYADAGYAGPSQTAGNENLRSVLPLDLGQSEQAVNEKLSPASAGKTGSVGQAASDSWQTLAAVSFLVLSGGLLVAERRASRAEREA